MKEKRCTWVIFPEDMNWWAGGNGGGRVETVQLFKAALFYCFLAHPLPPYLLAAGPSSPPGTKHSPNKVIIAEEKIWEDMRRLVDVPFPCCVPHCPSLPLFLSRSIYISTKCELCIMTGMWWDRLSPVPSSGDRRPDNYNAGRYLWYKYVPGANGVQGRDMSA